MAGGQKRNVVICTKKFMRYLMSSLWILMLVQFGAGAQSTLVSGPWAGNVELRNASVWAEVSPAVRVVAVKYFPKGKPASGKIIYYKGALGKEFNPVKIELNGLEPNTAYQYALIVDGKTLTTNFATQFTTKDLWQYRKPAPDFSFLAGSCAYFNEPVYDRPGKPYGGDSSIFETMAKTPASFHIWMGDNWYTREVDYGTVWGLNYRASRDRGQKILQPFMASMPQYAIWDDHDYGPNDAGKSYPLKEESRNIFRNYSLNPTYGEEEKGIYTQFSYSDVDFFLTDDRFFRSHPNFKDSIDGKSSALKTYFGSKQMDWLKNALLTSDATFKIIVTGSQILNPMSTFESMTFYSFEYNDLIGFLAEQKIPGVIFFTGDRHHSEVVKMNRPGIYPLYDVTISPYTAGVSKPRGAEANNPARIANTLVEAQNFGRIDVSGQKNQRVLKVNFIGIKGEQLAQWSVSESELKTPAK